MGQIQRFDLTRIIGEYNTRYFFETGTFLGDGVGYAAESPFNKIISVEIIPEIADKAKLRFKDSDKIEIIEGNSFMALENELPKIKGNCLFWLDAHFPGADAGITAYDADGNEDIRLPLAKELAIIKRLHSSYKDVLIIDDLRIYEDGPYAKGNVPADALPKIDRNIDFIYKHFGNTHLILKSFLDEGYVLLFPKMKYYINRFRLQNLFKGTPFKEDYYLTKNLFSNNLNI
ncbi:MAG: hypothetical protein ICV53_00865 [Flavisolibacter sp.]|nr:hypothetical protein [Flavisolibacter sp.]